MGSREVVDDDQVGLVARRDGAEVPQAEPLGGVEARHRDGPDRVEPSGDRQPHGVIEVALVAEVVRGAIVGDEQGPPRAEPPDDRQQLGQVLLGRALADHQPHAEAQLLLGFLGAGGLVVALDPGRDIGAQVLAR